MTRSLMGLPYISALSKEGKDLALCSSFSPISLINEDIKLYENILGERLKNYMSDCIEKDQAGFVPGREARDNVWRTIFLIHRAKKGKKLALLLSIGAKKVIDRVDWGYMLSTLQFLGLGLQMYKWIEALYSKHSVQ